MRSDERYGELQIHSVALEVAKTLSQPEPYDLDSIDLGDYKGIRPPWNDWQVTADACTRHGVTLAEALLSTEG